MASPAAGRRAQLLWLPSQSAANLPASTSSTFAPFSHLEAPTASSALLALHPHLSDAASVTALVLVATPGDRDLQLHQLRQLSKLRAASRTLFLVLWHVDALDDPLLRWEAFQAGANMVSYCPEHLETALGRVASQLSASCSGGAAGTLLCNFCDLAGLTPTGLWHHHQLYHSQEPAGRSMCPICDEPVKDGLVHVHKEHHPDGLPAAARTGLFSLVVVRRPSDGKFLVVQERQNVGYWLPGGGVDAGESLCEGAVRECQEEAGITPVLEGVLDVESHHNNTWRRFIFLARPADPDQVVKTVPDYESSGACWISAEALSRMPLRAPNEMAWITRIAAGAKALPLAVPREWQEAFKDVLF